MTVQVISTNFDMDFEADRYTEPMSGSISQMQMVYSPEEDRILFRVKSTDREEFRFWITRRFALMLARVLGEHKATDVDVSAQATPEAKQAVQSFKKDQAISEANFDEKFEAQGNEFPLGEDVRLAYKLAYNIRENGNLHLGIQPKTGQGINLVLNQTINISMTQLLVTAASSAAWKLDEMSIKNTPPPPENRVIN